MNFSEKRIAIIYEALSAYNLHNDIDRVQMKRDESYEGLKVKNWIKDEIILLQKAIENEYDKRELKLLNFYMDKDKKPVRLVCYFESKKRYIIIIKNLVNGSVKIERDFTVDENQATIFQSAEDAKPYMNSIELSERKVFVEEIPQTETVYVVYKLQLGTGKYGYQSGKMYLRYFDMEPNTKYFTAKVEEAQVYKTAAAAAAVVSSESTFYFEAIQRPVIETYTAHVVYALKKRPSTDQVEKCYVIKQKLSTFDIDQATDFKTKVAANAYTVVFAPAFGEKYNIEETSRPIVKDAPTEKQIYYPEY